MIFRATALFLALSIGIGAVFFIASDFTQASARKFKKHKKKHKKYRKYSKRWWRAYHNRIRKRKAAQARKRKMRLRRIRLAKSSNVKLKPLSQNISEAETPGEFKNVFILVEGKITEVFDGETVAVAGKDGKKYVVRMLGVDAPDISQTVGIRSQKNLSETVLGKNATVILRRKGFDERYFGTVYSGGRDVNLSQLKTGMAVYVQQSGYQPTAGDREIYEQAEQTARANRKGIWGRQKFKNTLSIKKN